jgi:hypothetical protein
MFMGCLHDLGNRIFHFWDHQLCVVAFAKFVLTLRIVSEPLPKVCARGDILCPRIQTEIGIPLAAWPKAVYRTRKPSTLPGSSYALLSKTFIVGAIRNEDDIKNVPCTV